MSDVNNITLSGRLTRDAVLKTLNTGNSLCEFSIASNRQLSNNEETVYMDVDLWGKRGESIAQYLVRGKYVIVTGRLKQDLWTGQDGSKKSKVILVADSVTMPPLNNQPKDAGDIASETSFSNVDDFGIS